jgi:hypothetical protein
MSVGEAVGAAVELPQALINNAIAASMSRVDFLSISTSGFAENVSLPFAISGSPDVSFVSKSFDPTL